jgi:hypothetical protein
MDGNRQTPAQQFAAAWQVGTEALGEWRQRVAEATTDALAKLDPAVRAAIEAAIDAGRSVFTGDWNACHCQCGAAHPDDRDVCDGHAVLTRRLYDGEVSLCAPCAVAQGVAEMRR